MRAHHSMRSGAGQCKPANHRSTALEELSAPHGIAPSPPLHSCLKSVVICEEKNTTYEMSDGTGLTSFQTVHYSPINCLWENKTTTANSSQAHWICSF